MKRVLDGSEIGTLEAFWDAIENGLALPHGFGRNLDALWDVLTRSLPGPVVIAWQRSERSRRLMGTDFERVAAVLRRAAAERQDLTVTFE